MSEPITRRAVPPLKGPVSTGSTANVSTQNWQDYANLGSTLLAVSSAGHLMAEAAEKSGSHVVLPPAIKCLPCIQLRSGRYLPLFRFVEAVDGAVDYEDLLSEFPDLTYAQIHGSMQFLRRIAMFNTDSVDLDGILEQSEDADESLIVALRRALTSEEEPRVLDVDHSAPRG